MLPPEMDVEARRPVWDALQVFWLDTDPEDDLEHVAKVCRESKYSVDEIEQIYWNELYPATRFNLWSVAGVWAGFNLDWLTERILKNHRFGKLTPVHALRPDLARWWERLRTKISP